jgi:hypothetical protein
LTLPPRESRSSHVALTVEQKKTIQNVSSKLCLATTFIHESDHRWCGELSECLENSFVMPKGTMIAPKIVSLPAILSMSLRTTHQNPLHPILLVLLLLRR